MKVLLDPVDVKQLANQIVFDVSDLEGWAGDPHRIAKLEDGNYIANAEFIKRIRRAVHSVLGGGD